MKRSRALIAILTLAACGEGEESQGIQQRVELKPFESCAELESYIKTTAVREMKLQIEESIGYIEKSQQKWRWGGPGGADAGAAAAADGSSSGSKSAAPDGPAAHTKTNTQVEDVDEPDFVKNDGTRILVLSGNTLYTAKSWPPSSLGLAGQVKIEGNASNMFLDKNRVVVLSTVYTQDFHKGGSSCIGGYGCGYGGSNALKITVLDVSDLSSPKVTAEALLPGQYHSARRVGSSVRIVLSDHFRWPEGVRFYPEYEQGLWDDPERLIDAYRALESKNEQLIRAMAIDFWLPKGFYRQSGGKGIDFPYACSDFHRSNAPVRLSLGTVITLNLDKLSTQPSRTAVVGGVSQIFASKDALYLSGQHWWWRNEPGQQYYTYFHKFDIKDPSKAKYVASGGVDGYLLDQFAMDEHKGFFRVATTESTWSESQTSTWGQTTTANRITVLRENAGQLEVAGRTGDLAKGERIYSVRFQGDRGYVVTFRQVDPLFTLDLSKPSAPKVVGELKVPGFSTYIHPLDSSNLLTIGVHIPDSTQGGGSSWRERSMKLTIFDVSDFAKPREKFTQTVGTAYGWSEAAYEHKAFNYFAERKLLAIPFSDYTWDYSSGDYWSSFISDVRVFRIDTQKGISQVGAISLKDVYQAKNNYSWQSYYSPWVRRSVMAVDKSGIDYVYAIADIGIRVAAVSDPATPIQTLLFKP